MFAKLLKHDLKSVGKAGKPLCIGALILSLLGGLASVGQSFIAKRLQEISTLISNAYQAGDEALYDAYTNQYTLISLGNTALVFALLFVFLLLSAACLTTMVLVAVNFYKTLITDQGYLTFTLPVSPTKILLSKIINGTIWNTIISLIFVLGVALIIIPSVSINELSIFSLLFDFEGVNRMNLVLTIFLFIQNTFFGIIASQIFYFFAIFLGGVVAKKHKLLAGGGIIVGGHVAYYIFQQIASLILSFGIFMFTTGFEDEEAWLSAPPIDPLVISNISLLFSFISLVAIILTFFFLTKWLMNKKLNLP